MKLNTFTSSKRMTILHVARIDDIPQSGVANVVPNYVKYQSSHAHTALLNIREFVPQGAEGKYPVFFYQEGSGLVNDRRSSFENPDLIVFHEVYWPEFLKIARLCRRRGIPYIIVPHVSLTDTAQHKKRMKKAVGNILFFNRFIEGAVALQFLSASEKDQTSIFQDKPYFIRNNGIQLHGKRKTSFSTNSLNMVYVGRFDYRIKGIDRIIDAISSIQDTARQLDITVDLYGPLSAGVKSLIDNHIASCNVGDLISIHGGLYGEEKIKEILKRDVFIQLSRTEGQPLGIMEALDLGMPCIVTDGTTFGQDVDTYNLGILVGDNPNDIGASIIAMRTHLEDLPMMSHKASKYAREHFGWDYLSPLMIHDYKKIIEDSQPS